MKQYKLLPDQIYEILAKELNVPVERCTFTTPPCFDILSGSYVFGAMHITVAEDSDETNG